MSQPPPAPPPPPQWPGAPQVRTPPPPLPRQAPLDSAIAGLGGCFRPDGCSASRVLSSGSGKGSLANPQAQQRGFPYPRWGPGHGSPQAPRPPGFMRNWSCRAGHLPRLWPPSCSSGSRLEGAFSSEGGSSPPDGDPKVPLKCRQLTPNPRVVCDPGSPPLQLQAVFRLSRPWVAAPCGVSGRGFPDLSLSPLPRSSWAGLRRGSLQVSVSSPCSRWGPPLQGGGDSSIKTAPGRGWILLFSFWLPPLLSKCFFPPSVLVSHPKATHRVTFPTRLTLIQGGHKSCKTHQVPASRSLLSDVSSLAGSLP